MLEHDLILVFSSPFGFKTLNASKYTKTHVLMIKSDKDNASKYTNTSAYHFLTIIFIKMRV